MAPVNEDKDRLQVELVPSNDAWAPLPKALRLQIRKVTEAAREAPASEPASEREANPEQTPMGPQQPLPALPVEPDANQVQQSNDAMRLRILRITPAATPAPAIEPVSPQPESMRLRILGVTPEASVVPPTVEPVAPLPEAVRLRIVEITEAGGPVIINRGVEDAKIRIMGVQDAPPPARPRITGIIATPEKE